MKLTSYCTSPLNMLFCAKQPGGSRIGRPGLLEKQRLAETPACVNEPEKCSLILCCLFPARFFMDLKILSEFGS